MARRQNGRDEEFEHGSERLDAFAKRVQLYGRGIIYSKPMRTKRRAAVATLVSCPTASSFDDVNDLVGTRAQDDVSAANQDEIIPTPFGVNFNNSSGKWIEVYGGWHCCAH